MSRNHPIHIRSLSLKHVKNSTPSIFFFIFSCSLWEKKLLFMLFLLILNDECKIYMNPECLKNNITFFFPTGVEMSRFPTGWILLSLESTVILSATCPHCSLPSPGTQGSSIQYPVFNAYHCHFSSRSPEK